jgi:hypothetical protein
MLRNVLIVTAVTVGLTVSASAFAEPNASNEPEGEALGTKLHSVLCHTQEQIRAIEERFNRSITISDVIAKVNSTDGPYACIEFAGNVSIKEMILVRENAAWQYGIFHVWAFMGNAWTNGYLLTYRPSPKA